MPILQSEKIQDFYHLFKYFYQNLNDSIIIYLKLSMNYLYYNIFQHLQDQSLMLYCILTKKAHNLLNGTKLILYCCNIQQFDHSTIQLQKIYLKPNQIVDYQKKPFLNYFGLTDQFYLINKPLKDHLQLFNILFNICNNFLYVNMLYKIQLCLLTFLKHLYNL